jgi:hypothetical protein
MEGREMEEKGNVKKKIEGKKKAVNRVLSLPIMTEKKQKNFCIFFFSR